MAVEFGFIRISSKEMYVIPHNYESAIDDYTCEELKKCALDLKLTCLRYLDSVEGCIFNYSQCKEILIIEIPLLRSKRLSRGSLEALSNLEGLLKEMDDFTIFLWIESGN